MSRGLLLITLLLLLLCNILTLHPLNLVGREKKSADEHEGYFTTGDSLNSQKRHSGAENKVQEPQNRDSEGKNKAESDEVESRRETNKLRLQHLNRACEEVSNANLSANTKNNREMGSTFSKRLKSDIIYRVSQKNRVLANMDMVDMMFLFCWFIILVWSFLSKTK